MAEIIQTTESPEIKPEKDKDGRVICHHCKKAPGLVKQPLEGGEVYWALECDCKTTRYYRSKMFTASEWETETYKQSIADNKIMREDKNFFTT